MIQFSNTNTDDGYNGLININPSLLFVSGATNDHFFNILRNAKHGNYPNLEALCVVLQPGSYKYGYWH